MESSVIVSVGRLIRESRQRLDLTQHQLADRAGISVGSVRDLEQGRSHSPRARSIEQFADVLGLSIADRGQLRQLARRHRPEPVVTAGPVRISVLGPVGMTRLSQPVPLGSGRHRVVLARVAMTPNHPVSREELISVLWADDPPPSAANVVQTHISRLRRIFEPGPQRGASDAAAGAGRGHRHCPARHQ